jgi:SAM-dependent methyltransferase
VSLLSPREWDERYRRPDYWAGREPVSFLRQVLPFLPRGHVLDLASGEGRNAVYLAAQGWQVTGLEWSSAGIEKAVALAGAHGVHVVAEGAAHVPGSLRLIQADLEQYELPAAAFDVVLVFYYLQRSLMPAIGHALRPGGILVYETYTIHQLEYAHGPRSPQHLLQPGELRAAFGEMEILFYGESDAGKAVASLLARKPKRS